MGEIVSIGGTVSIGLTKGIESEDPIVSVSQARHFRNALEEAGDKVHMYYVPGGLHSMGGELFDRVVTEFLDYYMKEEDYLKEKYHIILMQNNQY